MASIDRETTEADLEWRLSRVPISYNSVAFYRVATSDFAGYIFGIFFFPDAKDRW